MLDTIALRFQKFAPIFLRIGLALVFLLFGIQKLSNPSQGTSEIQLLLDLQLADAAALNFYLGLIEILLALLLIGGLKVRFATIGASVLFVLFFLSFFAKYGTSINPEIFRDIGLLGGAIALFLLGPGPWSLDQEQPRQEGEQKI